MKRETLEGRSGANNTVGASRLAPAGAAPVQWSHAQPVGSRCPASGEGGPGPGRRGRGGRGGGTRRRPATGHGRALLLARLPRMRARARGSAARGHAGLRGTGGLAGGGSRHRLQLPPAVGLPACRRQPGPRFGLPPRRRPAVAVGLCGDRGPALPGDRDGPRLVPRRSTARRSRAGQSGGAGRHVHALGGARRRTGRRDQPVRHLDAGLLHQPAGGGRRARARALAGGGALLPGVPGGLLRDRLRPAPRAAPARRLRGSAGRAQPPDGRGPLPAGPALLPRRPAVCGEPEARGRRLAPAGRAAQPAAPLHGHGRAASPPRRSPAAPW